MSISDNRPHSPSDMRISIAASNNDIIDAGDKRESGFFVADLPNLAKEILDFYMFLLQRADERGVVPLYQSLVAALPCFEQCRKNRQTCFISDAESTDLK